MHTLARLTITASAVLALAMSAGCEYGTKPAAAPFLASSSPAPALVSPSPPAAGAATALGAYRLMWQAYVQAVRIPDPAYPDLARYSQGDAFNVFVKGLSSVKNQGLVGQGDVTLNPLVTAAHPDTSPPTVEISDCVDTSASHLVKRDGSPYHDTPGGTTKAIATVSLLADGSWKVTSFALFSVGSC